MPDEAPVTPDTPDTSTTTGADTTDWQQRYQSLQPEYTRTTQALKDEQSVWEDEQAALAKLAEKFPHLFEDESDDTEDEPVFDDDDDPVAPVRSKVEQIEAWQQQVERERGEERFNRDLKAELGDEKVPAKATDWIKTRTAALGNNPKALKQAVEEYREITGEIRGPERKPAPQPPGPGKAGEKTRDPRNREERRARMAAALAAGEQG